MQKLRKIQKKQVRRLRGLKVSPTYTQVAFVSELICSLVAFVEVAYVPRLMNMWCCFWMIIAKR